MKQDMDTHCESLDDLFPGNFIVNGKEKVMVRLDKTAIHLRGQSKIREGFVPFLL